MTATEELGMRRENEKEIHDRKWILTIDQEDINNSKNRRNTIILFD